VPVAGPARRWGPLSPTAGFHRRCDLHGIMYLHFKFTRAAESESYPYSIRTTSWQAGLALPALYSY
jgi:hypothetical protein